MTNQAKHTPEPLSIKHMGSLYADESDWPIYWIENKQGSIAEVRRGCEEVTGDMKVTAQRFADCYNACAGMENPKEVIEGLKQALIDAKAELQNNLNFTLSRQIESALKAAGVKV